MIRADWCDVPIPTFYFSCHKVAIENVARHLRIQCGAVELRDVSNKGLWSGGAHIDDRVSSRIEEEKYLLRVSLRNIS